MDYSIMADLYPGVSLIEEHWIVDPRDRKRFVFLGHQRDGRKWRIKTMHPGDTYTSRILPGFSLILDPGA